MNNPTNNELMHRLQELRTIGNRIAQGRTELKRDQGFTQKYQAYTARVENNQTPTQEQMDATNYIKQEYDGFLEEPASESDPEVETSPEYKERKKANALYSFLKEELIANQREMQKINTQYKYIAGMLNERISAARASSSVPESSNLPESSSSSNLPVSSPSSSAPESSVSSNLPRTSSGGTSDYIDSLPVEYNPMDDLGID